MSILNQLSPDQRRQLYDEINMNRAPCFGCQLKTDLISKLEKRELYVREVVLSYVCKHCATGIEQRKGHFVDCIKECRARKWLDKKEVE